MGIFCLFGFSKPEEVLKSNEGYYLARIWVNDFFSKTEFSSGIKSIRITGEQGKIIKRITIGRNHRLLKLEAGNYSWSRVVLYNDRYYDLNDNKFDFKVDAGKINYGGDFGIVNLGNGVASFGYHNRSSFAYKQLKTDYPELLDSHKLHYTGHAIDPYFDLIQEVTSDE